MDGSLVSHGLVLFVGASQAQRLHDHARASPSAYQLGDYGVPIFLYFLLIGPTYALSAKD
jgi:hypothetical protein